MDEFKFAGNEFPPQQEFHAPQDIPQEFSQADLLKEVAPYYTAKEVLESREYNDEREIGLKEAVDAAREIFTPEVISEWARMTLEQRNAYLQEYQHAIADSLGVERGEVYYLDLPEYERGYNNGDGNVYLNINMLADPKNIIGLIDVIAHETRHQFQRKAIEHPDHYGISSETAKEWAYGMENYTGEDASCYDPWGYHYNPVETDARFFGESVVRELTKGMINKYASVSEEPGRHLETGKAAQVSFGSFINDRDWHIKQAERALEKGDMNGYKNHMTDARRSTK